MTSSTFGSVCPTANRQYLDVQLGIFGDLASKMRTPGSSRII